MLNYLSHTRETPFILLSKMMATWKDYNMKNKTLNQDVTEKNVMLKWFNSIINKGKVTECFQGLELSSCLINHNLFSNDSFLKDFSPVKHYNILLLLVYAHNIVTLYSFTFCCMFS